MLNIGGVAIVYNKGDFNCSCQSSKHEAIILCRLRGRYLNCISTFQLNVQIEGMMGGLLSYHLFLIQHDVTVSTILMLSDYHNIQDKRVSSCYEYDHSAMN